MLSYGPHGGRSARVAFTSLAEGNLALHVGDDPAAVHGRRARLAASLGLAGGAFQFMDQVHSARVVDVPPGTRLDPAPTADALVCADGSVPLAVMTADCVPVVFVGARPDGSAATAVAHAGRKGLLGGVLQNTLARLRAAGAGSVSAWIGPAVCGSCYEVPGDMAAEAERGAPGISCATSRGTTGLDLPSAAARILAAAGVQVTESGICTLEDGDYPSHRRDPSSGRCAGLVWLEQGVAA
ncbi:polyphenol oxidase family protein [Zafaria sp. Z1313]|uniref:polyphenol oxidase family protein n=1 Tax=unclassified Zafaria TaxID=2828765 RepID=UPI002E787163|nr:polyphenol oxidase family protein [Zafaria sp. J156]MEE1620284.1 polyphenol oxidase family protein [Zafaria sp. J156]